MDEEGNEYKFLWFIENYSYSPSENGKIIISPKFSFDAMKGTIWKLYLYPNGCKNENKGNTSLFLARSEEDDGPEIFSVNYQLSFLAKDGSALQSRKFKMKFSRNTKGGSYQFVPTDEIFLRRKSDYLPKDTLSLCCKMWKEKGNVQSMAQISARTLFLYEKVSFLHVVESFSTLQPDEKKEIQISSHSQQDIITSNLFFTSCSCEEIMIEIQLSNTRHRLQKCKLFLLDRSGNLINCGRDEYGHGASSRSVYKLPLALKRETILNKKAEYLTDDKLQLLCKCIFSTGFLQDRIEETIHELPLTVIKRKNNHFDSKGIFNSSDVLSEYPSALDDMKAVYINQLFSDVELKTQTKSFKAHKNVLCVRSPVFEAMLTCDMREKNTHCITVEDLENDTIQQLLLFIYSDSLENLHWKSATQLYYAADKYQIGKLKAMCSSFLTENLNPLNASNLLLLADTHNDSTLKKAVEDFILKHEEQVFGSKEWEKLIETNPLLVIKTMHLKYKRKNEEN